MLDQAAGQISRIETERAFHNARYGSGEDTRAHLNKYYVAIADGERDFDRLVTQLSVGKAVLEYGCADGSSALSERLIPRYARTYDGIDIADAAIRIARHRADAAGHRNCTFHAMNAEEMTFADESFDLIYGHGILHHLDLAKCFAELRRTLKPKGCAVFMEPLGHNPLLNWYRARTPALRTPDEHPLLARDLALAEACFDEVELKFSGLTTLAALPFQGTKLARASLSTCIAVDRLLLRSRSIGLRAWYALMILKKQ